MSFIDLALHRRSIRKYTEQPVEQEKISLILQAALSSPSSKHLNPWEFVVLTDKEQLSRLAGCKTYGSQMLQEAALGIVVALDSSLTDTWQADGAIAAMNMLLAAEDLGLGACWVQVYNREGAETLVREATGIPESMNVLCIISIGYKAEEKKQINPDKLQYNKVHYGRY